jgi:hypothetical protein
LVCSAENVARTRRRAAAARWRRLPGVEPVAEDLLNEPVHGQGLLAGLDQGEAAQGANRLVEGEGIVGQIGQVAGRGVELLGEQLPRDLFRRKERAHLEQADRTGHRKDAVQGDLPGAGHGVGGVAVTRAALCHGQRGDLAQPVQVAGKRDAGLADVGAGLLQRQRQPAEQRGNLAGGLLVGDARAGQQEPGRLLRGEDLQLGQGGVLLPAGIPGGDQHLAVRHLGQQVDQPGQRHLQPRGHIGCPSVVEDQ